MMDIRKIKKLIQLLNESNIGELEVIEADESVRIIKNSSAQSLQPVPTTAPAPQPEESTIQQPEKIYSKTSQTTN